VKFHRIAVYPSVLYGADFICESIFSVLPHVDHVFVVMMDRPWGGTPGVTYKGQWVPWPDKFDATDLLVFEMMRRNKNITITTASKFTPWNRWGFGVNDIVRNKLGVDTEEVVILDPDCVFSEAESTTAFFNWNTHPEYEWAAPSQVELWRTPAWQVVRPRQMVSFHRNNLDLISSSDPPDGRKRAVPKTHKLVGHVHNLGFCVSERTMRWKHLTSMAFSPIIGESVPNPDWLDKWLTWKPGVRDLEPSLRCENAIREAVPYDIAGLPASIKRRYDAKEWPQL